MNALNAAGTVHSQMDKVVKMFSYLLYIHLLEYSCFTLLCQSVLYSKGNQPFVYIYPPLPFWFPTHLCHHTEHWAEFPLCVGSISTFFIHRRHMSIPTSQIIHPPLFPLGIQMFVFYVCVFISVVQDHSIPKMGNFLLCILTTI